MKWLFVSVLFICLTGCDLNSQLLSSVDEASVAQTGAIKIAIAQAPQNLDPRVASDAASERVNRLIYRSLIDFDATSRPIPQLASWEWVNPLTLRLTLKADRKPFHHGQPLTSDDVKATYESLLKGRGSPKASEFANIARIEIINDEQCLMHLKAHDDAFVEKLIIGIMPKSFIDAGHDFSHAPVGSGPLMFDNWNHDLTLKRIADEQMIQISEVKDPTVRVLKLLRGEVDLLQGDLPPELVSFLENQRHLQVKTGPGANFSYLGFNYQDPLLKQLNVRKAIAHAIDVPAIIKHLLVNDTQQAGAILPPSHYAGNPSLKPYDFQPDYAKTLLKEAGIKLPLKLVYKTSTDAQRVRIATVMQAQMRKAGIELSIKSLDWGTFFDSIKKGQFQLYGLTWVGIKTPDIYTKVFHSQMLPPMGLNRGRFQSSEIDQLLTLKNWPAATTAIHQALPYVPLWYEAQFIAAQQNLTINQPATDGNWDMLIDVQRIPKP